MYKELKRKVRETSLRAYKLGLFAGTSGNLSLYDDTKKVMAITPSSLAYEDMQENAKKAYDEMQGNAKKMYDEMQENAKTILWGNLYLGTETEKDLPCPDVEKMTLSDAEKAVFTDENGREYAPLGHLTFETEEKIQNSRSQMIF